jgi:hypothetical protein
MKMIISTGVAVMAAFFVAGCATKPDPNSFGGRLQMDGGEMAAIGKSWTDGEALIIKGRASVADGEGDINKGNRLVSAGGKKIRNGETMVKTGETMKIDAEEAYRLRSLAPEAKALAPTS